jgi:Flp pilus assembly pilin Flp
MTRKFCAFSARQPGAAAIAYALIAAHRRSSPLIGAWSPHGADVNSAFRPIGAARP